MPLKTKYDIDQAIEHLNKSIGDAIRQSTPAQQDLPDIIKQHMADKRRLRKLCQITRAPQDKAKFNRATAQLKRIPHAHKTMPFNITFNNYQPLKLPTTPYGRQLVK
jgi:hypothetical protein